MARRELVRFSTVERTVEGPVRETWARDCRAGDRPVSAAEPVSAPASDRWGKAVRCRFCRRCVWVRLVGSGYIWLDCTARNCQQSICSIRYSSKYPDQCNASRICSWEIFKSEVGGERGIALLLPLPAILPNDDDRSREKPTVTVRF